jgi:hypothetical protein
MILYLISDTLSVVSTALQQSPPLNWTSIIVALIGLLSGGGLTKIIMTLIEKINTIKSKTAFEDISKIYDSMQNILDKTIMKRILVFASHNSGQEIKAGVKLYTSVFYEKLNSPFKSVKHEYQDVPLDADYINMLIEIMTKGRIIIRTQDMPHGLLKAIYEQEGVKLSKVLYLTDSKRKKVWYMSCSTDEDISEITKYESELIKKEADAIGRIIKKYNR